MMRPFHGCSAQWRLLDWLGLAKDQLPLQAGRVGAPKLARGGISRFAWKNGEIVSGRIPK